MRDWQNIAVVTGAVVFVIFLLWQFRPVRLRFGAAPKAAVDSMAARIQARSAPDAKTRAKILCDAAQKAAAQPGGVNSAVGLFLRSMMAEPTSPEPIECIRKLLLGRRPRALERILWKRLAHAEWEGDQRAVAAACACALHDVYAGGRLHDRSRATAMRKLARQLGAEPKTEA